MARLNKTEKLMQQAAMGASSVASQAFERLVAFYADLDFLYGENDLEIIKTLYCTKHNVPFEVIAGYLGTSVSRLENKRKAFQKIFLRHYEQLIEQEKNAA